MKHNEITPHDLLSRLEEVRAQSGQNKIKFYGDSGAGRSLPDNLKKGTFPSIEKMLSLADYLGCSVDYLLGRDTPPIETDRDTLAAILRQLPESDIDDLIQYAEFLLSKRQRQAEPTDQ